MSLEGIDADPAPAAADAAAVATESDVTIRSAADGLELTGRLWSRPDSDDAPGVLVVSHGLGEHSGCYREPAEAWATRPGLDVLGFDFRGHGRSPGPRGVVGSYDELLGDLEGAIAWARAARPGRPVFALGHSNGGLVLLRTAIERRPGLAGLVLSNPSIQIRAKVPAWKRLAGEVLRVAAPSVTLRSGLDMEELSADPATYAERRADALCHDRINAALYFGMVDGGPAARSRAGELDLPTFFVVGGDDPVIDPEANLALFEALGAPDKTLRLEPETRHEPFRDRERAALIAAVGDWLAGHLPGPAGD